MSIDIKLSSLRVLQGATDEEVMVTMKPTYTEERRYVLPRECLTELRSDLERLVGTPISQAGGTASDPKQIKLKTPKKWMVGSGLPKFPAVIVIFDPQSEAQAGYALAADAALKMAAELVKQAEALKAHAKNQGDAIGSGRPKNH